MLKEMVYKMFINATTLVSFVYFGSQILRDVNIKSTNELPLKLKIICGILGGILGCLLMVFHLDIESETIIDFRSAAQIILGIYIGFTAAIIQSIIMIAFRLFFFGVGSASVIAGIMIVLMAIVVCFIGKLEISARKKWIYAFLLCGTIISVRIYWVDGNFNESANILLLFWLLYCFVITIAYNLINNVYKNNEMYIKLKEESIRDYLTGLNNIRSFDKVFDKVIFEANEKAEKLSVLAIDIDFFKKVNDTYGHAAGDAILKQLGEVLLRTSRGVDFVARVGGEEFAIILPDCDGNQAVEIGEMVRRGVELHSFILPDGKMINITVSIGACCYPDSVEEIDEVKKRADDALYRAKHEGRNRVCLSSI